MKTISVIIDPQGRPKIEANGFTDGSCKAATAPLEAAFGNGDRIVEDKPEAFIPAANSQSLTH